MRYFFVTSKISKGVENIEFTFLCWTLEVNRKHNMFIVHIVQYDFD